MKRIRLTVLSEDKTQECKVEIDFDTGYICGMFGPAQPEEQKEAQEHGN